MSFLYEGLTWLCKSKKRATQQTESSVQKCISNPDLLAYILRFIDNPYSLIVSKRVCKSFQQVINQRAIPYYAKHVLDLQYSGPQIVQLTCEFLRNRPMMLKNFTMYITWETDGLIRPEWKMAIPIKLIGSDHDHFNVDFGNSVEEVEEFMRQQNHQKIWAYFNVEMTRFTKTRFRRIPMEVYRMNGTKKLTRLQSEKYQLPNQYLMKCVMTSDNKVLQFYVQKGFTFSSDKVLREFEYVQFFRQLFELDANGTCTIQT